ncbi:dual specificity protein phosphatase 13 isoform X2 [Chionomys nivalis]|uniref:dual specificity protein phosphatase 13 isoform X2 n=1 Tax=Chionomys nivalis TaxID=269649 RepID=UPI002597F5F1|nr:dual specificity protein phosphatase 13 isoform X2 [Chionomys nivalis]
MREVTANNRFELWKLGITHVLNAAHGGLYCQGGPDFYGSSVSYLGVPAHDLPDFDISTYFSSAADFIHRALNTPGGARALCGGCEPLRHTSPGLPHATSAALLTAGNPGGKAAPMDLPQPWFPPPAPPAGPATAGCRPELRNPSQSLSSATRLCHFVALALALALLAALAQVDAHRMERAQGGAHPQTCCFIGFLQRSAHPLSCRLQSSQKQHQVCRDRRLEAGSPRCPSEKTTAWTGSPHRMDSLQKQDLRRPKIHGAVQVSPYQPPTLASLQRLLWVRRTATLTHINEVWPNLFLGDAYAARDKNRLIQLGITHVVNVAAGKFQVDTGAKFYRGTPLEYYGIEADDNPFFDLSVYFLPVARYIRDALNTPRNRVLVHCAMGVSRSATVVLAFLMICENMTLVDAIQTVQVHRDICPNSGFLRQLQVLDNRLRRETGRL